jgi:oxygen-dependent protoporphyrinogen oxidase
MNVIVIGGGISGLATAHFLKRGGGAGGANDIDVTVIEPGAPGGVMGSVRREGFLCERGPQALLASAPAVQRLIDELGLRARVLTPRAQAKRRKLYRGGRLHDLPSSPPGLLFSSLLSVGGRFRVLREPFVRKQADAGDAPETLRDFAARRLGPEAADRLLVPAVMAIFAGDARALEAKSAFPALVAWEKEHGSLFRGALASVRANKGRPRGILSFPEGLGELASALAAELGPALVSGRAVKLTKGAVAPSYAGSEPRAGVHGGHWSVEVELTRARREGGPSTETLTADAVILACPPTAAAALLRDLAPAAAAAFEAIPVAPAAIVHLGFAGDGAALGMDLDAYGFIAARNEGVELLGCQYESSIFPERAPTGHVLLRAIVGGTFDPGALALEDDVLVRRTVEELGRLAGLNARPQFTAVWRHPLGIPQYTAGHAARVATIERALAAHPRLYATGNALRGVGLADCITRAALCAEAVAAPLASPPTAASP